MKYLFRIFIFVPVSLLLAACGSSLPATALPVHSPPTATKTPTIIPTPSLTATAVIETAASDENGLPTLVPTMNPTLLPGLLSKVLSVQRMEGINGHSIQRITGWDHGFGGGYWWYSCPGFVQLDDTHFLLYPAAGQVGGPEGYWVGVDTVPQPVVIDLKSGSVWQPPVKPLASPQDCNTVHWSQKLGLFITTRVENGTPMVTTYKMDGNKVADYPGSLLNISPGGTKILVDENRLVNLETNKTTELKWPSYEGDYPLSGDYYWTLPDESHVYHCCSFYADLSNDKSFRFRVTDDLQLVDVNTMEEAYSSSNLLPFMHGEWVRDNTFFLVHWSWVDDGDIRYLPMFDPEKEIVYDVREKAGISPDLSCPDTTVSNTGSYVWLECYDKNYLINLYTFEANEYPGLLNMDVGWAADDQFVWLQSTESEDSKQYYVVSTTSKELKQMPIKALTFDWADLWWHPRKNTLAYLADDGKKLGFVDAQTLSVHEKDLPYTFKAFYWSPRGDRIALVAEDGSVWQVDYPALEDPEQLTPSVPFVKDLSWSADSSSISFVGGTDIYIVNTAQ